MKKKSPKKLSAKPKLLGRKLVCAAVMAVGLLLFYHGISLIQKKNLQEQTPQAQIEVTFEEISDEEELPALDILTPPSQAEDFLYAQEEDVTVIKPEEAKPELLAAKSESEQPAAQPQPMISDTDKIAALIEREISFELPNLPVQDLTVNFESCNQEVLDKIYEEELPNNIIDEPRESEYIHINHTKVKDLKIIPRKKPYYFGETPVIAVVIDDMGVSQRRTGDIASLKAPITASFLTYSANLEPQIENSRQAGHEIMIHVPMEAQKTIDAAPDMLTTRMTAEELQKNFSLMLEKFHGIKGINNHMGSKLTEDESRMEVIMKVLKKHQLFFLDSKTSAKSKAETAARKQNVAYGHRHVFLDNNNDKAYILRQLALTEKLARKNGYAIAIGHPKSQTFEALKDWLQTLPDKQIRLVHLSEIMAVLNPQSLITALK